MKRAEDRRVQRTRKLLQDALNSMMIEKGYEATTVQDIIDRANVGRSTFYAHFADKETLLASRLEDLRAFLAQQQRQARMVRGNGARARDLAFSLPMLNHARDHVQLYGAIIGRESGAIVLKRVHRTIAELAYDDLEALGFKGAAPQRDLAAEYLAGAFMAVLTWWLDHGAKLSPEEVDAIFRRLVMHGLTADLGVRRGIDERV
jgi:AcrR family transcriptional regulator